MMQQDLDPRLKLLEKTCLVRLYVCLKRSTAQRSVSEHWLQYQMASWTGTLLF